MAQQTAVEWLVNHWKKLQSEGEKMSWNQIIEITQLAKEMEKEQISKAWIDGRKDGYQHIDIEYGNQYYNETYNK